MKTPAPVALKKTKLENGLTVRFSPEMRSRLNTLAAETGRDLSDIVRDSFSALWPEIEALNKQLGYQVTPEQVTELRAWMQAGERLKALGLDLSEIVDREARAAAVARANAA